MRRTLFLLLERLQITRKERISILVAIGILCLMLLLRLMVQVPPHDFSREYEHLSQAFDRLSAVEARQDSALMAQYFPERQQTVPEQQQAGPERQAGPQQQAGPERQQTAAEATSPSASRPSTESAVEPPRNPVDPPVKKEPAPLRVNVNTAGTDSLGLLPGIGSVIAERIVNFRDKHGDFKDIEDLKDVSGIGDVRFEGIRRHVTLN